MDLIGQQIDLLWFTTDADGNAQNLDATPEVEVEGPAGTVTSSTTNESTGQYRTSFTPSAAGRHVAQLTGLMDTVPEVAVQWRVIHDPLAEGLGESYPDGVSSWASAVS